MKRAAMVPESSAPQTESALACRPILSESLSTVAASCLSAVLAARVNLSTGLPALSVLVFAFQWLPPLCFAGPFTVGRHAGQRCEVSSTIEGPIRG